MSQFMGDTVRPELYLPFICFSLGVKHNCTVLSVLYLYSIAIVACRPRDFYIDGWE
jgi:hypothetical protein